MLELFGQGTGQGIIEGYKGGTNPILLFLIFALLFAILLSICVYISIRVFRRIKFKKLIENDLFEKRERALFRSYVDRLRIYDPIPIFLDRQSFDSFVDSISHLHEVSKTSHNSALEESSVFTSMREKLGFIHNFDSKRIIKSTRSIPVGYPVTLSWSSSATNSMNNYYTTVQENTEFFIAVSPPSDVRQRETVVEGMKTEFDVSFARKGDAQYFFYSHLIRMITQPEPMWLIFHSHELSRAPMLSPLRIPAILMYTKKAASGKEDVYEYSVTLGTVNNQGCLFLEEPEKPLELQIRDVVIVNFTIEEKSLSCRASISNILEVSKGRLFQVLFSGLSEEDSQFLVNFRLKQKNESLKKLDNEKK